MIHEHEALEVASAALDFPLSPAAARELELALRDCPICAERAAGYRDQQRLMKQLPAFEVSDATRRRIVKAAVTGRADSRPPMLLLAAALLLGLMLAVAAIAGSYFDRQQKPNLSVTEPFTSPAASADPSLAVATPAPVGSDATSIGSGGAIPADSIMVVVSDNLRVRSAPRVADDSIKFEPLLRIGDRLFVIQGPVVANDYEWYEVAPVGIDGERPWFTLPTGWVARGDHDGTPWVAADRPRCPEDPSDIEALAGMHSLERLACFGDRPLAFRAFVQAKGPTVACDPAVIGGPCVAGPAWLAGVGGWTAEASAPGETGATTSGPALTADPTGAVRPSDLPDGRVVALEGSFDHPAAANCTAEATSQGQAAQTQPRAKLWCRSRFVVTRAEPAPNVLVPDTVAVTVSDNVRVRSLPRVSPLSARLTPLLDTGTRVFVLGGPVVGSGYDWYEVVVPSVGDGDGLMVGWVSVASKSDEPWVAPAGPDCPSPSGICLTDLIALTADPYIDGGLACFGRRLGVEPSSLRFEANVGRVCDDGTPTTLPDWLAAEGGGLQLADGGKLLTVRAHPDLAIPIECSGNGAGPFFVEGKFDHDDASACRANPASSAGRAIDERVAIYRCRARFVVTELTPADS